MICDDILIYLFCDISAAFSVFLSNIVIVIGPTPPGTGDMYDA